MAVEIERKYLINKEMFDLVPKSDPLIIKQGYLLSDGERTIRIRISNEKAFLTIKGKPVNLVRPEFEYEIPFDDALFMLKNLSGDAVEKIRYEVLYEGNIWEVDMFEGTNAGLCIAEIELDSATQQFAFPPWVTKEVTDDHRYYNSYLAKHPFSTW